MQSAFLRLSIITALVLSASVAHAADKWISIRSRNFVLVGNASESSIKRVARELEEFRAGLGTLFPSVNKPSPVGTTVLVFKDDASFRPYKPLYEGKAGNVAGYFQAGEDMNFIALAADRRSPHVVYHEFVHSLTKDTSLPLPPWASEGFAEVYSMFELSGKDMTVGRAVAEHVLTLNRERMLPLDVLLSVGRGSPYYNEKTKQGLFYAQSWASVHYMLFGANGKWREQFVKYLNLSLNGKTAEENFREAFKTDYATLEDEIRKYIRNQVAWPAIQVKLPDKLDFDRELQVAPVSDAQAQFYLGDLLLHMSRLDVAEAQLQKAVTLDPKLSAAYASLGLLKIRDGKSDEALKFLEQAVAGDSKNHLAHFHYAFMLQRLDDAGSDDERKSRWNTMRTHIQKTIELAPNFTEAYGLLGYVALVSKEGIPDAENALKKAINYAPGRLDLRLRLAELMVANDEVPAAQTLLASLKNTGDDVIRYQSERLLDHIKNRQEYERDLRAYEEQRRQFDDGTIRRIVAGRIDEDEAPKLTRREEPAILQSDHGIVETAKPQLERASEGIRVEGVLTYVDCTSGLTLRLRVNNAAVELHTNTPDRVEFVSYVAAVTDTIACGVIKPEVPVAVVYKRGGDRRFLGEPLRVDFVKPN
jgi:tetratricopeptide (TPR) repeat protein